MCSIHILIADPMMKHPNAVLATQNKTIQYKYKTIQCIREMSLKSMVTYLGIVKELPIMQVRNPGTVCLKHEQFS